MTQHKLIWESYLNWSMNVTNDDDDDAEMKDDLNDKVSNISLHAFQRYIKLVPNAREDMIQYLLEMDRVEEALPIYEELVQMTSVSLKSGK